MEIILKIGADPTRWLVEGGNFGSTAAELKQSGPVALAVAGPLRGTLVLSMAHVGTVALLPPNPGEGSHPSDNPPPIQPHALVSLQALALHGPALYLPSVTGATPDSAGYGLPADTDLAALEQGITTAMTDGSVLTVPLAMSPGSPGSGLLLLHGATLAFAVICPPAAQG